MTDRSQSSGPEAVNHERASHQAGAALAALLLLVLWLHLLEALVCGLATYVTYRRLLQSLEHRLPPRHAQLAAVILTLLVFAVIGLLAVDAFQDLWVPQGGLAGLLALLADTLDRLRSSLPPWIGSHLPGSADDLQQFLSRWLRSNAHDVQKWSRGTFRVLAYLLLGFVIGLMAAFQENRLPRLPWVASALQALENLSRSFADIVAAQLRIAAANAALTAAFLLLALPLAGVHLPLSKTLVTLTFVAGLIPIVGNLVSNAAIVLVALTVSPGVALACLVFLLVIHKLEYVLNAHFVGERTRVPAPLLLAAMLMLEAAFGVAGLVAAPIYCAWAFRQFASSSATNAVA